MTPELIAELSCNHLGSFDRALVLIDAAKDAGAHAVKFQCWVRPMCLDEAYEVRAGPWRGRKLASLYRDAQTPAAWFEGLARHCQEVEMPWFASVFDDLALDLLEELGCQRYKISSFELPDVGLIEACANTGKPLIISTGMATLDEIDRAAEYTDEAESLTLLVCASAYPAPPGEIPLGAMRFLADRYGCSVGLSDHTLSRDVAVAAAAMGATLIEKHLTLLRADGGPDAGFSLEPQEFAEMASGVATAAQAAACHAIGPKPAEAAQRVLRRSLYVAVDSDIGQPVRRRDGHVVTARPAGGLPPRMLPSLEGKLFACDVKRGMALRNSMLE